MNYRIPFNQVDFVGRERDYVEQAIANGHISGGGPFTRACHELIQKELGVGKVLLTTSCTHALEMSALLAGVEPGAEVIVPDFAFVSTANAFALYGARPVFVDVREDTLNLDERRVAEKITPNTRAIVPIHYAGVACEMDALSGLARERGLALIEDNAHGLFGRYRGRYLGTFGDAATLSFHETKNFTCGEGGALLVNREDWFERAEVLREKGTNRTRFLQGQVQKYTWVDVGSSWLPSDILAAFLHAQLDDRERIQTARRLRWERYRDGLAEWAERQGARLPVAPAHCEQTYHMFYLLLPEPGMRSRLIEHLKDRGILAVFHYLPLHLSDMGRHYGAQRGDCPVSERISERILRLPFYTHLSEADQGEVIQAILDF